MKVFEFHFNPPKKQAKEPDLVFDTFCFEPENAYEKRLGGLYLVGLLKNVLPQNVHFLNNLSQHIKEKYYRLSSHDPEKALKDSLKSANEYLEEKAKRGDVSWLGNINLVILALKNFELNFTKVGNGKIYLLRNGGVIDIEKGLEFEGIEPYPLKTFGNIVSGKLAENDAILVLTKEIADFFRSRGIINKIAAILPSEEKKLGEAIKGGGEELAKIPGACLLVVLIKEEFSGKKEIFTEKLPIKKFSFEAVLRTTSASFKKLILSLPKKTRFLRFPTLKFSRFSRVRLPSVKMSAKIAGFKFSALALTKKQISIFLLIVILLLGYFISQFNSSRQVKDSQKKLDIIEETISEAENLMLLKDLNAPAVSQANSILKENYEEISGLARASANLPESFKENLRAVENRITENLFELNKLTLVENPERFFEFSSDQFIPQKLVFFKNNLYLFSLYAENAFEINASKESRLIETGQKTSSAVEIKDSLVFFAKPDKLAVLQNGSIAQSFTLPAPYSNPAFDKLASFKSNLYFLDQKAAAIVKYPYLTGLKWAAPQIWMKNQKAADFSSIAVDGSVWFLDKDNRINRYYFGELQETLVLDIFPEPENLSKIFISPNLPYIHILEPGQKRVIIVSKSGKIVKQFQSQKFDSLLDFTVSDDGKTIYLLNGLKVYKIKI